MEEIGEILKEEINDFYEVYPNLKIKALDIIMKKEIKELEEEFKNLPIKKELIIYKINPINGRKTKVKVKINEK